MKNTWSKMIALIAVAVVLLSGCGETKVSEPYVVEQMYSLAHKPEQVFRHTDDIIVGTVLSLESQKLYNDQGYEDWMTFAFVSVEDSLYGSIKKGDTIPIAYGGAPGKKLFKTTEKTGSYPQEGERLLYMLRDYDEWKETGPQGYLVKELHRRNAFGIANNFAGVRTVDADGNLGYRYDPFENGYKKDDLPFYEYKTVEQLRAALPQLLRDTEEYERLVNPTKKDAKQDQQQDQQQDTPEHSEGEVSVESGLCSPTPEEREAMGNQNRQDAPAHSEGEVPVESGLCSPTPEEREAMGNQNRQDTPAHSEGEVSVESGLCSPTPEERETMENAGE